MTTSVDLTNADWFSRAEALSRPSPVPSEPGVYAWFFREVPTGVPTANCLAREGYTLLYVGISPKAPPRNGGKPSSQNLRKRIRQHLAGNASGSTLRLSLGCLLGGSLGIELRPKGRTRRLTFGDGEEKLSAWLDENTRVTWLVHSRPWEVEPSLIADLDLPLNIDHNAGHSFCQELRRVRAGAKARARALPLA